MCAVFYVVTLLSAMLIQTSPLLFTVGSGLRVDILLLVVVYFSLFWNGESALLIGFVAGLCQDALSSDILGANAFSKTLSAFVVHILCRNIQVHSVIAQVLFTCIALIVDTLAHWAVMVIFQVNIFAFQVVFIHTFAQQALLSILCVPLVCRSLQACAKALHIPPTKGQGNAMS